MSTAIEVRPSALPPERTDDSQSEVESLDRAIEEASQAYAANEQQRGTLLKRLLELQNGATELRRKRARNYLDQFILPVRLLSIEEIDRPSKRDDPLVIREAMNYEHLGRVAAARARTMNGAQVALPGDELTPRIIKVLAAPVVVKPYPLQKYYRELRCDE